MSAATTALRSMMAAPLGLRPDHANAATTSGCRTPCRGRAASISRIRSSSRRTRPGMANLRGSIRPGAPNPGPRRRKSARCGRATVASSCPRASAAVTDAGLSADGRPSAGTCGATWGNDVLRRLDPAQTCPLLPQERSLCGQRLGNGPPPDLRWGWWFHADFCANKYALTGHPRNGTRTSHAKPKKPAVCRDPNRNPAFDYYGLGRVGKLSYARQ